MSTTDTDPGLIVTPAHAGWDEARLAWNLAVDQQPAAIARPRSVPEVVEAIAHARAEGLRVAAQATGHAAAAMGPLDGTLLIKLEHLRTVAVDPERRIARAGGGAIWADVTAAAAEHGLAGLAGSSPDVGVAGYTLGGGMSWFARRYGFAANNVHAVELVTASGEVVRADADQNRELFWALRGGGGSFGVVTAIELALFPVTEVYAGTMVWPIERTAEVLTAWRRWVENVPDEVTSLGRVLHLPPIPDIPEPLRGRSLVAVEMVCLLDPDEAAALVEPLRALGPEMDTTGVIPAAALQHLHMDPEHPVPGVGEGMIVDDLDGDAIDAVVRCVGPGSRTAILSLEMRHLGGALARPRPDHGAIGAMDGFGVYAVGIAPAPEAAAAISADLVVTMEALEPWRGGRSYMNFCESRTDCDRLFGVDGHARLRAVKAAVDPDGVFRANHPIVA
jgi:FAD/FMN-containing dehydrogenase